MNLFVICVKFNIFVVNISSPQKLELMKNWIFNLLFTQYKFLSLKKWFVVILLFTTSTLALAQAKVASSTCSLICPSDMTFANDPGVCGVTVNIPIPTLPDSCGITIQGPGPVITISGESGYFVYTAIEGSSGGTLAQCGFGIFVIDVETPVVNCPSSISATITDGACSQSVTWGITASDNCGVNNVNSICIYPDGSQAPCSSGDEYPIGTTIVISSATDNSGNQSSCSFQINVNDATPNNLFFAGNISNNTYYANQNITSSGNVPNGGNINFKAGQCIELRNDFTVQSNADFSAEINDCN